MTHQDISIILDKETKDAALDRIGYFVNTKRGGRRIDTRAVLKWFVDVASKEPEQMNGETLTKKGEEYRALQKEMLGKELTIEGLPPNRTEIASFQATLIGLFTELTEKGRLALGPFLHEVSITVRLGNIPSLYSGEHFVPRLHHEFPNPAPPGEPLIYLLAQCLRQGGDLVKRCEWCKKFFLQTRRVNSSRREQKFCSHTHRTLASKKRARDLKEARRQAVEQRKINKKAGNKERASGSLHRERRKSHGKR